MLVNISGTHQRFANNLRNQRVIEHPEEFLGSNWKDVLNFWIFLDTLSKEQWKSINDAYYSLSSDENRLAYDASRNASRNAVGYSASDAAWAACLAASYAADVPAGSYAAGYAAVYATRELIGSHILQEQGKSLVFFPLFLNP